MNDLHDLRQEILRKAREKYVRRGITANITDALRMYLENDAGPDEQIPLMISTPEIRQIRAVLEQVRPRCDECDGDMRLQINSQDPAGKKHATAWHCKNCGIILYSDMTPAEWMKDLQDEARNQKLPGSDESD